MANLLRDNAKTRWVMLFILAFVMFAAYVASDNIFAVENTLFGSTYQMSGDEYSSLAGAYSIFNVYFVMLILGGLILDKKGIRFTGIMSAILMVVGIAMLTFSMYQLPALVASGVEMKVVTIPLLGTMRTAVIPAVIGMGIYGVGAEIAGITVTKAIAKWFVGYEMALAMGLQLSLARLGTGLAYGATPAIVKLFSGSVGAAVLVGLVLLGIGLLAFLPYCAYDRKLDKQIESAGVKDEADSSEEEFHLKDVLEVVKNPAFWMIAFLCLLFYAAVNPFLKYSTGLMINKFGIDETLAGLFPMILPMGCIVLTPIFGGIYDRKGHGADLMILGAVIIMAVHLIFAIPANTSTIAALVLMVCLGIGFALLPSAMWPSIAKIMPAKLLGTTMALTFYIQNIGFIFVPKAVNAIKAATGGSYLWFSLFFAGLGLVAVLLSCGVKLLDKKKHYGLQIPNIQK